MNEDMFLGKPISYWIELDNRAKELNVEDLLQQIVILSAKVNFYERKIIEINDFRTYVNKMPTCINNLKDKIDVNE